ncbi:GntR family transcriptional regulator [Streptomyces violens]|uniref:GntR family transcriptional regulator n=1 Tax=Streptomyces violens TaxID=66377 RepID=UPI0004C01CD1|nr:GntR family transcriptional regulator [Streptomyces violens]
MAKRYEVIAADLRQQIQDGSLPAGSRLPAETALTRAYRVGLPTVRQALSALQAEGLIEKQHGRGSFVRASGNQIEYANDRRSRRLAGPAPDIDVVVTCCEMKATEELAARLNVQPRTRLLEFSYRGRLQEDESPCSLVRSYLVYDMVAAIPMAPVGSVGDGSPWGDAYEGWLINAGIELDHVTERVGARPPTADEARVLGIFPGVSVLAIQRTSVDTAGRVVEVADLLLSGDRMAAVYKTPVTAAARVPG